MGFYDTLKQLRGDVDRLDLELNKAKVKVSDHIFGLGDMTASMAEVVKEQMKENIEKADSKTDFPAGVDKFYAACIELGNVKKRLGDVETSLNELAEKVDSMPTLRAGELIAVDENKLKKIELRLSDLEHKEKINRQENWDRLDAIEKKLGLD